MTIEGYSIELDLAPQVLSLSIWEWTHPHGAGELFPTLAAAMQKGDMVPAAALAQKAKQFDDGVRAAVALAIQHGAGALAGKAALLRTWIASLGRDSSPAAMAVAPHLLAAAHLGGLEPETPPALLDAVNEIMRDFLANEAASKPLGFYTWSDALRSVFQQDRLLQSAVREAPRVEALARALDASRGARAASPRWTMAVQTQAVCTRCFRPCARSRSIWCKSYILVVASPRAST